MALAAASAVLPVDSTTNASPYTTASFTPPANCLLVCYVCSRGAATNTTAVTDSIGGTWARKTAADLGWAVAFTQALFAQKVGAAPAARTVSAAITGTISGCHVHVEAWTGYDDTVATADLAIIQAVTSSASGLSGSLTLAAASNANNRPGSCWAHGANELTTPRANWTELDDGSFNTPASGCETQARTDAFETTATASWTTSAAWGGVAYEVKASTVVAAASLLGMKPHRSVRTLVTR